MNWNGQDVQGSIPSLGLTLPSALLYPEFVRQALLSGLFQDVEHTLLTPLDDLKQWMREDPWRSGELFGRLSDALLGPEKKARKAAEKAGQAFDLVAYELDQMEADETFDSLTPDWAAELVALVVEEGDALLEWSLRELHSPFAITASLTLPDPRRHPMFPREQIAKRLGDFDPSGHAAAALQAGRLSSLELQGAIQLDLSKPGESPRFQRGPEMGSVKVAVTDLRAGDQSHAHLSLAYPLAAEGYFLLTFDALRQGLTLKEPGV